MYHFISEAGGGRSGYEPTIQLLIIMCRCSCWVRTLTCLQEILKRDWHTFLYEDQNSKYSWVPSPYFLGTGFFFPFLYNRIAMWFVPPTNELCVKQLKRTRMTSACLGWWRVLLCFRFQSFVNELRKWLLQLRPGPIGISIHRPRLPVLTKPCDTVALTELWGRGTSEDTSKSPSSPPPPPLVTSSSILQSIIHPSGVDIHKPSQFIILSPTILLVIISRLTQTCVPY